MVSPSSYDPGTEVVAYGRLCTIKAPTDVDEVLIVFKDNGEASTVPISVLGAPDNEEKDAPKPIDSLHNDDLAVARERFEAIKPVLEKSARKNKGIEKQARKVGVAISTLYNWIKKYEGRRMLSDLAPERRAKRKGRLNKKVEVIIQDVIETNFLNKQKITMKKAADLILMKCRSAKLKPPHRNTIYNRIKEFDEKTRVEKRKGKKAARDQFGTAEKAFPNADYPLACVQIDHTKLDIELVDDKHRLPIGRPWLTMAIDVYSRVITGIYLSFDAPSAFSVGMCISHCVLKKDTELDRLKIKGKWPVWGLMNTIHTDNGADFRSQTIQKSCDEYGINIEWRPVKKPEFGGHIERLMKTVAGEVHSLPGSTFSNIIEKGVYNSSKEASLTFDELYRWILEYITGVYHQTVHRGINATPEQKWKEGILGKDGKRGIGMPKPVIDGEKFLKDFLPYEERTVQRNGISWGNVQYFSPAIKHFINAKKGKNKVKFIVRRDPRDISEIYFLDPEKKTYIPVRYADRKNPPCSIWEFKAARHRLLEEGGRHVDEKRIFEALERMAEIEVSAKEETKKKRREDQKKKNRNKHRKEHSPKKATPLRVVSDNDAEVDDSKIANIDIDAMKKKWKAKLSCQP